MTGFKMYGLNQTLCLFPPTHRNVASSKSWLPTITVVVMACADAVILVKHIACFSLSY
jgi:hypothetical protein